MQVIITGGSGLIGQYLTASLTQDGIEVIILSRDPNKVTNLPGGARAVSWDGMTSQGWGKFVDGADAIVNLAGENISGEGFFPRRWTPERKQRLRQSRLSAGKAVLEAIEKAETKPKVLAQSSAIGYYGSLGDEKVDEESPSGKDFFARLCQEWEASTQAAEDMGVRRVVIRSGVVLTTEGGALPRLLLPFKLFAGGPFGNGRQYMSWIHIADEVAAIRYLIKNTGAHGVFNLTAPNPQTNAQFGKTLGKVMNRPYFMPVPGFALKTMFGEVSTVVLDGQRVIPTRLLELGYNFQFPELETGLRDILGKGK